MQIGGKGSSGSHEAAGTGLRNTKRKFLEVVVSISKKVLGEERDGQVLTNVPEYRQALARGCRRLFLRD